MHARALYFTVITNLNFITKIVKLYVAAHFIQVLKKLIYNIHCRALDKLLKIKRRVVMQPTTVL